MDFVVTVVYSYMGLFYPWEVERWGNVGRVAGYVNGLAEVVGYYGESGAIKDLVAP